MCCKNQACFLPGYFSTDFSTKFLATLGQQKQTVNTTLTNNNNILSSIHWASSTCKLARQGWWFVHRHGTSQIKGRNSTIGRHSFLNQFLRGKSCLLLLLQLLLDFNNFLSYTGPSWRPSFQPLSKITTRFVMIPG